MHNHNNYLTQFFYQYKEKMIELIEKIIALLMLIDNPFFFLYFLYNVTFSNAFTCSLHLSISSIYIDFPPFCNVY